MYKVACLLVVGLIAVVFGVPSTNGKNLHCSQVNEPQNLILYTLDAEHVWVAGNLSYPLPSNVVLGGFDPYGYYTYVGRVTYATNVLPARVVAETGVAHFNTDTISNKGVTYQLLTTRPNVDFEWVRSFDGYYERDAVAVGTTHWNERVYICRAKADGGLLIGTLFLSKKNCIIKNDDLPLRQFDKYETLVAKYKNSTSVY